MLKIPKSKAQKNSFIITSLSSLPSASNSILQSSVKIQQKDFRLSAGRAPSTLIFISFHSLLLEQHNAGSRIISSRISMPLPVSVLYRCLKATAQTVIPQLLKPCLNTTRPLVEQIPSALGKVTCPHFQ